MPAPKKRAKKENKNYLNITMRCKGSVHIPEKKPEKKNNNFNNANNTRLSLQSNPA